MQHEPSVYIDVAAVWFQLYGTFEIVISFLEHFQINQSLSEIAQITELERDEVIRINKKVN